MSVSRGGSPDEVQSEKWDDMLKQRVHDEYEAEGAAGGATFIHEQWLTLEPAGGLDRGEIAELVVLDIGAAHQWRLADPSGPNTFQTAEELTTEPAPKLVGRDKAVSNLDKDGTGVDQYVIEEEDDPDTLNTWHIESQPSWKEYSAADSAGAGGGSDVSGRYDKRVNFRREYGLPGPVFDRHDTLYIHTGATTTSAQNTASRHLDLAFVWDIREDNRIC